LAKRPEARFETAQAFLDALHVCEREIDAAHPEAAALTPAELAHTEVWVPPPGFHEYAAEALAEAGRRVRVRTMPEQPVESQPLETGKVDAPVVDTTPVPTVSQNKARQVVMGLIAVGVLLIVAMAIAIVLMAVGD
jgi:hypothetical protein